MSTVVSESRRRAPSLRRRLLVGLLVLVCSAWLAVTAAVYQVSRIELDELLDAELSQTARMLMSILEHEIGESSLDRLPIAEIETYLHRYERNVAVWIWDDNMDQVIWPANLGPLPAKGRKSGFSEVEIGQDRWRAFIYTDPKSGYRIQVADRESVRNTLGKAIWSKAGLLMLGALPLVAAGIWYGVGRGLRPLSRVSSEVAQMKPRDVRPIADAGVPLEARPVVIALNGLLARVGEALEAEHRFTAYAAHELRTPLAGLRTQLQVALRARDDDQRNRALGRTLSSVDRMTHLVNQLLTLARADSEHSAAAVEPIDVPALVTETVAELFDLAKSRRIDLHVDPMVEPAVLEGNRESIRIMLRNLVDNAIRYTPSGGQVKVSLVTESSELILRVTDSGPGIAPQERQRALERFHRLAADDIDGSGLGLSIVHRLAQLQGARLVLGETATGRGLDASLHFDCSPVADAGTAALHANAATEHPGSADPLRGSCSTAAARDR